MLRRLGFMTYDPGQLVKFVKQLVEVEDCKKITDHFRGIYRMHPNLMKENRRMSTCNQQLDLQTLGSQLVMPKISPEHCSRHCHGHFNIEHDLTLNLGSYPLLSKLSYTKVAWAYI